MKVTFIEQDQRTLWDAFVYKHENGTLCHQSKWCQTLESAFPHIRGHFLAVLESDSDTIIAGMPIYEVRSWILGDRLVSVPYSNWCDPIVSNDEQLELLLAEARKLGDYLGIKRIEIRCRATQRKRLPDGWEADDSWKLHTTQLDTPEADLWKGLSRTAVRLLVRKAEKSGIDVSVETNSLSLHAFYDAFLQTRQELGLPAIPYHYFESLQSHLGDESSTLFIARQSGELLGAVWLLTGPREAHLEFAASRPNSKKSGAMQLLYWRAMQLAQSKGCEEFSFGRTARDNEGLLVYKRRWNTIEEDLFSLVSGDRTTNKPSRLKALGKQFFQSVQQSLPKPIYQRLGSFLYSHWG